MLRKGILWLILAVVVGLAFRLFYDWISDGGAPPKGIDGLAAFVGLVVASLFSAIFDRKDSGRD